ncbi:MAG TPA: hypothetical protein VGH13_23205 [Xanthobacteraceae bacterium]|jgi:hypothetical protein
MNDNDKNDDAERPSCLQPPIFLIGQDSRGNWVVQEKTGYRGGLFVDRAQALRYIRSENGNHPKAFVTVSGVFELDMKPAALHRPQPPAVNAPSERRVA